MHQLLFRPDGKARPSIPSIRENFVAALSARDFKVHEFAAHEGIQPSSVYRWLNGKTWPTPENLERLARYLKCDPLELLMSPEERRLWQAVQLIRPTHS